MSQRGISGALSLLLVAGGAGLSFLLYLHFSTAGPARLPGLVTSSLVWIALAWFLGSRSAARWDEAGELRERLRSAETRLARLGSDAVHELRTPVAAVRASLEAYLRRPGEAPEHREAMRMALLEVQRLWTVVEGILALTRDGEDPATHDRRSIDLPGILSDTLTLVGPSAEEKSVRLRRVASGEAMVFGAGDRLRLLVFKLIDNAVRYAPDSSTVGIELRTAADDMVELVVEDRGPGIPEEDLETLFEYGQQIRDGLPDRSAGSGLGLSLVRWIAESHGGSIHASRRPAGGSRFVVSLPRSQAPARAS